MDAENKETGKTKDLPEHNDVATELGERCLAAAEARLAGLGYQRQEVLAGVEALLNGQSLKDRCNFGVGQT